MLKNLLDIILGIRVKYLPLLSIYFATSFAAFNKIAEIYWMKDSLTLTPSQITSIAIWTNLPWTMKILFGQFLDSVKIFGSQRNIYIVIAAFILGIGYFLNIAIANDVKYILAHISIYHSLIISGFLICLGLALQDLVADTLCYDSVDKYDESGNPLADEYIKNEIFKIQVLVRFVDIIAAIFAAFLSGWIANNFPYSTVSYFSLIIVLISVSGIIIYPKEVKAKSEKMNASILIGSILYLLLILIFSLSDIKNNDIIILTIGTSIISFLLYRICKSLPYNEKIEIIKLLLIIFAFRATPAYSSGVEWWQIDVLKFDPTFFSILDQISIILGFIGVCFLSKKFVKVDIVKSLFTLKIIHLFFQLPMILMAFGLHNWTSEHFNIGAKVLAILSVTGEGPFQKLEFMIICFALTYYTPKQNVATWFALSMSLVSIAYIGAARVIRRILADLFIIERGYYDNIAELLISTNIINILLPLLIWLITNKFLVKRS